MARSMVFVAVLSFAAGCDEEEVCTFDTFERIAYYELEARDPGAAEFLQWIEGERSVRIVEDSDPTTFGRPPQEGGIEGVFSVRRIEADAEVWSGSCGEGAFVRLEMTLDVPTPDGPIPLMFPERSWIRASRDTFVPLQPEPARTEDFEQVAQFFEGRTFPSDTHAPDIELRAPGVDGLRCSGQLSGQPRAPDEERAPFLEFHCL